MSEVRSDGGERMKDELGRMKQGSRARLEVRSWMLEVRSADGGQGEMGNRSKPRAKGQEADALRASVQFAVGRLQ